MEWVKLIAVPAYYLDGALLRAGESAEVLFCRALAYCGSVESEGRVDKTVLPMLIPTKAQHRAAALVREGLWLDEGDYFLIRSWDRIQDEHDAAAHRRRLDRDRQRKRRQASRDEPAEVSRDGHADKAVTGHVGHAVDVEEEKEEEKNQPPPEVGAAPRPKPTRATRIPDVWPPSADVGRALIEWATEHAPAVEVRSETANWQDWHRAKGDTAKDWPSSWRYWMRNAQRYAEKNNGRPLRAVGRVAEGDAILAEAFERGQRQQQPELGA